MIRSPKPVALIGLPLVALVAWGAWHLLFAEPFEQRTNDAFISADYTLVAPKVSGFISEVLVQDNQRVSAGQLLARIDDRDLRTALQVAKAGVASAEAQRVDAEVSVQRQQSLIDQAAATVKADQAEVRFAEHELQRYRHLAGQGAGTLQNAQQAQSRHDTALARLQQNQAALAASRQQTAILVAGRDAAVAALKRAGAELQQAELDLSYTELRAPIDGMVGRRALRVGGYVSPGQALLAVVPLERAFVVANFQETQLDRVRPGQPVSIRVDSYPALQLRGHVESLAPATGVTFAAIAPDNATGNFTKVVQRIPVKIVLDADQPVVGYLRVGMSVEASIDTHARDDRPLAQTP